MNFGALKAELELIVRDSSLVPYFDDWLNQAVEELAADFQLPGLRLLEPAVISTNTDQWLYPLPENYMKSVFQAKRGSNRDPVVILRNMADLDRVDPVHGEEGQAIHYIAVEGGMVGIYPKANDILSLWYYRKPNRMVNDTDEPDGIPAPYHARVIIPKVVIKNFKLLQDMMTQPPHQSLQWWMEEYRIGLYGMPRGDIGMINYLARDRKPRRHGGRHPLP